MTRDLHRGWKEINYYGRTALRDIVEAAILLNSTTDDRTDYYIEDSDGYTNIRESGSPKAKIITRIKSGVLLML